MTVSLTCLACTMARHDLCPAKPDGLQTICDCRSRGHVDTHTGGIHA